MNHSLSIRVHTCQMLALVSLLSLMAASDLPALEISAATGIVRRAMAPSSDGQTWTSAEEYLLNGPARASSFDTFTTDPDGGTDSGNVGGYTASGSATSGYGVFKATAAISKSNYLADQSPTRVDAAGYTLDRILIDGGEDRNGQAGKLIIRMDITGSLATENFAQGATVRSGWSAQVSGSNQSGYGALVESAADFTAGSAASVRTQTYSINDVWVGSGSNNGSINSSETFELDFIFGQERNLKVLFSVYSEIQTQYSSGSADASASFGNSLYFGAVGALDNGGNAIDLGDLVITSESGHDYTTIVPEPSSFSLVAGFLALAVLTSNRFRRAS